MPSGFSFTRRAWSPTIPFTSLALPPGGMLLRRNSVLQHSSEHPPKKHGPCTTANGALPSLISTVGVKHPP